MKLENRNTMFIEVSEPQNTFIKNEFVGYNRGLLMRIWEYAKMSGIREKGNFVGTSM